QLKTRRNVGLAATSRTKALRRPRRTARLDLGRPPDSPSGVWSGKRDSNPRPSAWKADALAAELFPRCARKIADGRPEDDLRSGRDDGSTSYGRCSPLQEPICNLPSTKEMPVRADGFRGSAGGGGRIRTFEGVSRQIYSLLPLAARAPLHVSSAGSPPTGQVAELAKGLEPPTTSLQMRCSTNSATPADRREKEHGQDSQGPGGRQEPSRRERAPASRAGFAGPPSGLLRECPDVREDGGHLRLGEHALPARHRALALVDRLQELRVRARVHVRGVVEVARRRLEALGAGAVAVAVATVAERAARREHLGAEVRGAHRRAARAAGPRRARWRARGRLGRRPPPPP